MEELGESKQRSRHGGTRGKLKAWRNYEKVSKDQGMEELGENKQRSRHGGIRINLSKDQGMEELG
jgi:hypothetical protein